MPVSEEFSDDDTLIINWNIENIKLHTCIIGECFSSPEFAVKKLGYSYWQLKLFPSGSNNPNYIACYIGAALDSNKFGYGNGGPYESYRFTLSLRVADTDFFERHVTCPSLSITVWKFDEFIRRDLLRPMHLPKGTLSIRCVIQPECSVRDVSHFQDFKYLSQNLISLLDSEKYSDLVLVTDDNTRFKVHKCILSSRWPSLPTALLGEGEVDYDYSNFGPEILVPNINSDTLETMINYAYSGVIDGQDVHPGVYMASVKLKFDTLRENLTSYPKTYLGTTKLTADCKIVEWRLDNVRSWDTKPPSFTRILRVTELCELFDIILIISISTDPNGDKAISIVFRISPFDESMSILMNCKISLSVQNGETLAFREAKHMFRTNDFWHFPQPFKKHEILDKRSLLTMEIVTSDGCLAETTSSETEIFTTFTPIVDLWKLSMDMYWLVYTSAFYPKDCTLVSANSSKFKAHRAVLWARWPQLRSILDRMDAEGCIDTEENGEEFRKERGFIINMEILFYMYSGHSKNISHETAQQVLDASKLISLPEHLLATCKAILENRLL